MQYAQERNRSNEIKSLGPLNGFNDGADAKRAPDIVPVCTHGMDGEEEHTGDVFVLKIPANKG